MNKIAIQRFTLGPLENNTYLLLDRKSQSAVMIDPAIGSREVIRYLRRIDFHLAQIWITHAHFDHYYGLAEISAAGCQLKSVFLHPLERDFFRQGGGGVDVLGTTIELPREISFLPDASGLEFGGLAWMALHTPGHRPGHVSFYSSHLKVVFCGDLVFKRSIGRTDLPGGDTSQIIRSIQAEILTLPDDTQLLPGHGPATTVVDEKQANPFLR